MTDEQIVSTKKYLKYGIDCDIFQEPVTSYARTALWAFEEINRQKSELAELNNLLKLSNDIQNEFCEKIDEQKAEKESLEIELQAMRNAANSYKSKVKTLEMDNAQLHSDIVNANQNYDHIKELWEIEKQKVADAKEKIITSCKKLQTAKAEIERLKGWQDLLKAEKHSLIKSEAIKKFENKILELFPSDKDFTTISRFTVKQIAKGMTEQKG